MKYLVTIKATVIKSIEVHAESEEQAEELAREQFTAAVDDNGEKYTEETLSIEEQGNE